MGLEKNQHVERLKSHLPFDANSQQLYAEYADPEQTGLLATRALVYVGELLTRQNTRMVVLTGDAGHGKTYLCRLLLEGMGYDKVEAKNELCEKGYGRHLFHPKENGGRPLRIIKDLSDFDEPTAAEILVEALADPDAVTLVCANEGRLRSVVALERSLLGLLIETLEAGMEQGTTSIYPGQFVINLNYQSVTAGEHSLARQLLQSWVQDRRKWSKCGTCDACSICPIYYNHLRLAGNERGDAHAEQRRDALVTVLRIAEQSGQVITIRELLILVAYLITGDQTCTDVHDKYRRRPEDRGWQHELLYHQLLFEPRLTPDQMNSLPMIRTLHRYDPGRTAIRPVDEALSADLDLDEDEFPPPNPERSFTPAVTRNDAQRFAEQYRGLMKFLRRRDYFEQDTMEEIDRKIPPTRRLGFEFHEAFEYVIGGGEDVRRTIEIRDALLAGLEAIQGMRRDGNKPSFSIVDPAFSRGDGDVGILALQIPNNKIRITYPRKLWEDSGGQTPDALPRALDWAERRTTVIFEHGDQNEVTLDLLQFEFLMRTAHGLSCRLFFQADIRRIMSRLAVIGSRAGNNEEIRVLHGNQTKILTIDVGDIIRCG
ncbi:MAG: hypothetical protein HOC20_06995 [Chloroflexi bacterium]|nr:hypothetical protein [Chloroflexota bacterium]